MTEQMRLEGVEESHAGLSAPRVTGEKFATLRLGS
jgi:hypothetical protein